MDEFIQKIIDNISEDIEFPTQKCMICDGKENPKAKYISTTAWICPACREKLRKIVEQKEE